MGPNIFLYDKVKSVSVRWQGYSLTGVDDYGFVSEIFYFLINQL